MDEYSNTDFHWFYIDTESGVTPVSMFVILKLPEYLTEKLLPCKVLSCIIWPWKSLNNRTVAWPMDVDFFIRAVTLGSKHCFFSNFIRQIWAQDTWVHTVKISWIAHYLELRKRKIVHCIWKTLVTLLSKFCFVFRRP